ncbi:MAG: hypothetical protein IMZ57_03865 [Acidobacteria bacterium]|nr:hypothetical protein [Acidobacteriota bacterium]
MANVLNPDAPFIVLLFAQRKFSRGAGRARVQISLYSKDNRLIVGLMTPGHIRFSETGAFVPIGQEETNQFVRLKAEFGKVVVKLSDSPKEPTFPTYEAFISRIA